MDVDGSFIAPRSADLVHEPTMMIEFSDRVFDRPIILGSEDIELIWMTRDSDTVPADLIGALCEQSIEFSSIRQVVVDEARVRMSHQRKNIG